MAEAPMPLDVVIARWVALSLFVFGVSHIVYPREWAAVFVPLRERESGGFLIATFNFPLGLVIVLGHNHWGWGLPVIVTVVGWMTTVKSVTYLLFPRAHMRVIPSESRLELGFRAVGVVMVVLGLLAGYDAFFQR